MGWNIIYNKLIVLVMVVCVKRFLGKSLNLFCVFYNGIIYMYIFILKEVVCIRIR